MNSKKTNRYGRERGREGILRIFLRIFSPLPAYYAVLVISFWTLSAQSALRLELLDTATVNDSVVRFGDVARVSGGELSDEFQRLCMTPIGEAAPCGYSRYIGVEDVRRIATRQGYQVTWEGTNKQTRITVKTGFQENKVGDFEKEIFDYIHGTVGWNEGDYSIFIQNRDEQFKCLKKPFTVKIDGLHSKFPKGNINFNLIIIQGDKQYSVHPSCLVTVNTDVVVANTLIPRNGKCNESNCEIEKRDITHFNYVPYNRLSDVRDKAVSRTLTPGTILHEKIIAKVHEVQRDEQVRVIVESHNVRVCMFARAREAGSIGEKIWVENEMTHKLLKAKIIEAGKVVLAQGEGSL
jgi:flagella basal body P-ring formation protein FlgA